MRQLSIPALAAHLAAGARPFAAAWRLTRRDGTVLGFTDHDRDALLRRRRPLSRRRGFDASEAEARTRLRRRRAARSPGALSSDAASTEADLAAGRYDNAEVEALPGQLARRRSSVILLRVGHLGEVTREDGAFRAELRGLAGRARRRPAAASISPALRRRRSATRAAASTSTTPAFRGTGTVVAARRTRRRCIAERPRRLRRPLVRASAGSPGRAAPTPASPTEVRGPPRRRRRDPASSFWQPPAGATAPGDRFTITAGCDKTFATCGGSSPTASISAGFRTCPAAISPMATPTAARVHDGRPLVK